MAIALTAAQVEAMAPDGASLTAGKKLGKPGPWKNVGQSDGAIWGECQGSAVYQTRVALSDFASKCSCPSRKFPCKHVLGLLWLATNAQAAVPTSAEPEWVTSWLEKRSETQQKKAARAESAATQQSDPEGRAKRAEKRSESILRGLDQLDAWTRDLVRQGLARVPTEGFTLWDAQARRLVDAQASGLAARLVAMGERLVTREDWAERLLDDLGVLSLLTHAYRRIDALDPQLAADVRRAFGLTLDQAEVIAHGDVIEDDWCVVGDTLDRESRVRAQRAWLAGKSSGRTALVLQFAAGTAPFQHLLTSGMRFRARLAYWPSASPERALLAEHMGQLDAPLTQPTGQTINAALDRFAALLAVVPWHERTLFLLRNVVPEQGPVVSVRDGEGSALPLTKGDHDLLFALSGGHPVTLAAEWDGYALLPLSVWTASGVTLLTEHSS